MSRLTIIEGNTNDKDNVRTFFGKAEKGDDGVSPEASITKSNGIATITIKDANGTTNASIEDGFDPIVRTSKTGNVATVEIEDAEGTHSFTLNDGEDGETYEVPTNSVIGWDSNNTIPNGYEDVGNFFENTYSTTETRIGTWIDGKPIYRREFNFGNLPDTAQKEVNHNISVDTPIHCYGTATKANAEKFTIPMASVDLWFDNSQVYIITQHDRSTQTAVVTLEYTKTTD